MRVWALAAVALWSAPVFIVGALGLGAPIGFAGAGGAIAAVLTGVAAAPFLTRALAPVLAAQLLLRIALGVLTAIAIVRIVAQPFHGGRSAGGAFPSARRSVPHASQLHVVVCRSRPPSCRGRT